MKAHARLMAAIRDIRERAEREHPVLSGAVTVTRYTPPGHYGKQLLRVVFGAQVSFSPAVVNRAQVHRGSGNTNRNQGMAHAAE